MNKMYLLIVLFFTACTLSADQESSLNNAVTAYVSARNNAELMTYVASTHPNVVAYYKEAGDSAFIQKFGTGDQDYFSFIQDGNIRDIEFEGKSIQVKYSFLEIDDVYFSDEASEVFIYAVSEDDGKSWYFIDQVDYLNDQIIEPKKRLIQ